MAMSISSTALTMEGINMPYVPDYTPSFRPVPNVTPFSIRDGDTMLKKVDYINKYLTRVLIPWIDENYQGLADAVEEDIQAMIILVNQAIQSVINNSITVQDPVVAGLIANAASQTRVAMDLVFYTKVAADAKFRTVAESYSKTDADSRFRLISESYTKTQVDTLIEGRASDAELTAEATTRGNVDTALSGRITPLEDLVNTGRLTQAFLDARYVRTLPQGHLVAIGSSNATPSTTWVESLASDLGLTVHNFSVGGGSFTGAGAGRFMVQATAAIADASFPKADVRIVLVADVSNDMRAVANVENEATEVFAALRLNYPNARIIVIPAIWNLSALNTPGNVRMSIGRRYYEMTLPAANYGVELINYSWTWHYDNTGWVESGGSGAHLSAPGYTLVRNMVRKYIQRGGDTDRPLGWKMGVAKPAVPSSFMYLRTSRVGNIGQISDTFIANDLGIDTEIAQFQDGANPLQSIIFECYQTTNRNATGTLVLFPSGLLRTYGVLDGGASSEPWTVNATYAVF